MKSRFTGILTLFFAFMIQFSFAQEKTITGTVTSADDGLPLPGVSVVVEGTTKGTQTDLDGKYSINVSQGEKIVFSFLGMTNQVITVGASNVVNVKLVPETTLIEGVSVEGYRTMTKPRSTSAVTSLTSEKFENRPNVSFMQNLQGQVPGLMMGQTSGQPGTGKMEIIIRGLSSLNGSTEPLYVIDGVPTNSTQFRNLSSSDIESVTILRDAAGTSVYGNRGANGVVMITTKRGGFDSSLSVSYNGMTGVSFLPSDNYNMSNSQQLLAIQKGYGAGMGANMTDEEIANFPINTDWKDVFFRHSTVTSHDLSLRSGSKNLANYTSIGYMEQEGIVPTTDFKRVSVRSNFNGKTDNGKFVYSSQIYGSYSKRNQLLEETSTAIRNNIVQNPLHGAMIGMPMLPADAYPTGRDLFESLGSAAVGEGNNIYILQDILRKGTLPNYFVEKRLMFNVSADYKITDEFSIRSKTGIDYTMSDRLNARAPHSFLALVVAAQNEEEYGGHELQSNEQNVNITQITSIDYEKTFADKHTVNVGFYTEYMKAHNLFKSYTQNGLDPRQYVPGAGTGYIPFNPATPNSYLPSVGAAELVAGTFSYFGLADYDYDERFGFSGSLRRDASYRFTEDKQWGTFWSVGGRWNIDKESFMSNTPFNMLKLRVSYGKQGNQNIAGASIYAANNLTRNLTTLATGYGNQPAWAVSSIANPLLMWEELYHFNAGVDFAVFNNRLEGNLDFYRKTTEKMFIANPVSGVIGAGQTASFNSGSMRNTGIETLLRYRIISNKDLNVSIFGNLAYNKNEIIELAGQTEMRLGSTQIHYAGEMAYQYYGVPYVGVNRANGEMLFLDINGNLTETPTDDDRRRLGKSPVPVYSGGFGFNADYRGFFMDVNFVFFADVWKLDNNLYWYYNPSYAVDSNVSSDLLNAWTPENPTGFPSLTAVNTGLDSEFSDRYFADASYLRLRNAMIGYSFSPESLKGIGLNSLKLFVQAENILTWTKWRGFDPEGFNASTLGGFPTPKSYSFGVNLEF